MDVPTMENEALKTLVQHADLFPQANRCIASQHAVPKAQKQAAQEADNALEVIWAGPHDARNNRVICRLTAKNKTVLNSCYVKVADKAGKTIAQDRFVSFAGDVSFASLPVPKDIFDQCSVQMDMAMVGPDITMATKTIPLNRFNAEAVSAIFTVDAPRIKRAVRQEEKIRISYYRYSPVSAYDYVYPGRDTDQMYFPSKGRISVEGVKILGASGNLMIKSGLKAAACEVHTEVSDSEISYSIDERWEGVKLSDCFDLKTISADVAYLLTIGVQDATLRTISLIVTNEKSLIRQDEAKSICEIPQIDAYLDCFAQGTQIRMADGGMKTVETIKKDDLIRTPDGGQARVKEVQVQDDCQVIGIQLADGRTLSVTDGHAVATRGGVFPAVRLKEGQDVLTEDGAGRIARIIPHCDKMYTVYALFLEGGQWLYADGMKAHSSDSGNVFEGRDWLREDLPEEWKTDYENAKKAGLLYDRR